QGFSDRRKQIHQHLRAGEYQQQYRDHLRHQRDVAAQVHRHVKRNAAADKDEQREGGAFGNANHGFTPCAFALSSPLILLRTTGHTSENTAMAKSVSAIGRVKNPLAPNVVIDWW